MSTEDEAAIRALAEAWHDGWVRGDADALLALYSADPVLLPQGQPAVRGREAILGMYQAAFEEFVIAGEGEILDLGVDGDLGYFWSTYALKATSRGGDGEPVEDSGNSLFIVRRQPDGSWKVTHLISNSDRPG